MAIVNFNNLTSANVRVSVKSKTPQSTISIINTDENPTLGGDLTSIGCCLSERNTCVGGPTARIMVSFDGRLDNPPQNYYAFQDRLYLKNTGNDIILYLQINNDVYSTTYNEPIESDHQLSLVEALLDSLSESGGDEITVAGINSVYISNSDSDNKKYIKIYDSAGYHFYSGVLCEYLPG